MAKLQNLIFVVVSLVVTSVQSAVGVAHDGVLSPRDVLKFGAEEVSRGGDVEMRGVVTFVSAIDGRFVVAPQDNPRHAGVVVLPVQDGGDEARPSPENGDFVFVAGRVQRHAGLPAVAAKRVDVIRSTTLPLASGVKQADFRRGLLYNRRMYNQVLREQGRTDELLPDSLDYPIDYRVYELDESLETGNPKAMVPRKKYIRMGQ